MASAGRGRGCGGGCGELADLTRACIHLYLYLFSSKSFQLKDSNYLAVRGHLLAVPFGNKMHPSIGWLAGGRAWRETARGVAGL